MVSIGPILQGVLKVPMTFLEVLSYALTIKGEGMIVSISRPIVGGPKRTNIQGGPIVNKYHRNLGTHAFNGDLQRSSMSSSFERENFIEKGKEGCKEPSTPTRDKTSCDVVSISTSFPFKASKRALQCF